MVALVGVLCLALTGVQVGHAWTFDELTAKADLVVIANHISTQDTARRPMHPELKPDIRVAEMKTDLKVLQVLKADAAADVRVGAALSVRHYRVIQHGVVNTGSPLRFGEPGHAYLVFLRREPDGAYEPVSGHTFPSESVYVLDRSDRLQPPVPPTLPDMSGRWMLINLADAPADAARELVVTQDAKSFGVSTAAGAFPESRTYALGVIGGVVDAEGGSRRWSAVVRLDSLVVETATHLGAAAAAQESTWKSEVWSVAGDRLTIQIKERRNEVTVRETTLVYRRR